MIRLALILFLATAGMAEAGPVGAAISAIVGAVKSFAASSLIGGFIVRTAVSLGLSLLARALAPKPKAPRQPGIQTEVTTTGGTESQAFILGRYATGGHLVAPPYSHGTAGQTPNAYLTYIVEVCDIPGVALSRVIVNDGYSDLGDTPHADYGYPLLEFRKGSTDHAWLKFYDGTQTAADAMLVAKYGSHPDRPWTADHIGTGTAYAVLTFRYNREVFNGLPSVRFELDGIALYDPRADTTVGGDGAQRWDDPGTWQPTDNPAVMIYNILRGITLPDGRVWGGQADAADLPLANWFAAMNVCDIDMDGRAQFRAGLEVAVAEDDPAGVIEELLKACTGQIAEYGGVWRIRIGAPAAPVYFLTDDDIIISDGQTLDAYPGLEVTHNAITATYPEPASLWQSREAPPIYNAAWEAEDGDRRLVARLSLPACPHVAQVGQVMEAYIKDERRFRAHSMVVPPDASVLEPLDTLEWTSARNGYAAKVFEVVEITSRPGSLCQEITVRERDPDDYDYDPENDLTAPPDQTGVPDPDPQPVAGWLVEGATIRNDDGDPVIAGLRLAWDRDAAEDAQILRYEVRVELTGEIIEVGVTDVEIGERVVSENLLPGTEYAARARYVLDRPTDWTDWLEATTPSELDLMIANQQVQIGKAGPDDLLTPGLYIGKDGADDPGFSLIALRQAGDVQQRIQIGTGVPLRIVNARHRVSAELAPNGLEIATSQTYDLPAGTAAIAMLMMGGGGAGEGVASNGTRTPGGPGGVTRVELWDGATNTGIFWEAPGGAGGEFGVTPSGKDGQSSAWGTGGVGAYRYVRWVAGSEGGSTIEENIPAAPGTGFGAGGGAGRNDWTGSTIGHGGRAAALIEIGEYDVSALADPKLVITIGAGGVKAGPTTNPNQGANGSPGRIILFNIVAADIPADVVPLVPTAVGSFSKASGATGDFPDLGAGLWVIDTGSANNSLGLNEVEVDDLGGTIWLNNANSASFISAKTPRYVSSASVSRTIFYAFYSMGGWGE